MESGLSRFFIIFPGRGFGILQFVAAVAGPETVKALPLAILFKELDIGMVSRTLWKKSRSDLHPDPGTASVLASDPWQESSWGFGSAVA